MFLALKSTEVGIMTIENIGKLPMVSESYVIGIMSVSQSGVDIRTMF